MSEKTSAWSAAPCPSESKGHRRNLSVDSEQRVSRLGKGQCFLNPGKLEMWAIGGKLWAVAIMLVSHFTMF